MSKTKKVKDRYITICPKCKSKHIAVDTSNPLQGAMGLPSLYICNDCGHSGYTFPEVKVSELEDVKKESAKGSKGKKQESIEEKEPLVDTSYGEFGVSILFKITGPLLILWGIIYLRLENALGYGFIILGVITLILSFQKDEGEKGK
ncbi:MAG: hypothetical protein ACMXYK_03865 [Candidatus Woesearchaeota archaeon]